MLKAFALSFRLRNAYKVNSILWSLKGIPLIKRLLPSALYASRGLKVFANILGGLWEFMTAFSGKALYLLLLWLQARSMAAAPGDSFTHLILLLTIAGGFLNTQIFNPTKDKFYAMFIMRMDAKQYTLANYLYFLIKMLVGFGVFSLLFGTLAGASLITCLAIPLYVVSVKLCFTAVSLSRCKTPNKTVNENKPGVPSWAFAGVLLLAGMVPPYLGFALGQPVLWALTAALILPAALSLRYILGFDAYRSVYQALLRPENIIPASGASAAAQQQALQKKITADVSKTSAKSGYPYFNELFMKRHSRLMTRSAKRITLCAVLFFAAASAAVLYFPGIREPVNGVLLSYLPYFLFIMYLINRGKVITQAMFMNCDHSMLTYRFYRQPKAILALFWERLKYVAAINLMPALAIGLGLPLLLYLTGGTAEPMNYVVLFVSILAMSVFFSVHNLVLYYLLQPYNVNLEAKSAAYGILNWVTYILCYSAIQVQLPTLGFGTAISVFCILYAIIAVLLAYRLAPRTFKLRS